MVVVVILKHMLRVRLLKGLWQVPRWQVPRWWPFSSKDIMDLMHINELGGRTQIGQHEIS